jgi:hypothetical protein
MPRRRGIKCGALVISCECPIVDQFGVEGEGFGPGVGCTATAMSPGGSKQALLHPWRCNQPVGIPSEWVSQKPPGGDQHRPSSCVCVCRGGGDLVLSQVWPNSRARPRSGGPRNREWAYRGRGNGRRKTLAQASCPLSVAKKQRGRRKEAMQTFRGKAVTRRWSKRSRSSQRSKRVRLSSAVAGEWRGGGARDTACW